MIPGYLKIALRVLARRKFFTFVSLFGIGFTLVVLIVVAALVDHFFLPRPPEVNRDRTLLVARMKMTGERFTYEGPPGYGFLDRYCRDLDGVERMSVITMGEAAVAYREGERIDLQLRRADGEYWHILDFEFLAGGPYTTEDDAAGRAMAVITDTARRRFFGEGPGVGRTIELAGRSYDVVGVVATVPRSSLIGFADVWLPIGTIPDPAYRTELMGEFSGLFLAESPAAFGRVKADFASRLPRIELPKPDVYNKLEGYPATMLELVAAQFSREQPSRADIAKMLALVGALVLGFLLLPAVHLVNLNVSRIYERLSEIGVRKAFGASSSHLVWQFVLENIVLCLVGGVIGFIASVFVLAAINNSGVVAYSEFSVNVRVFLVGMALAVFFGILSGIYPAWRMSRLHPVLALRGDVS